MDDGKLVAYYGNIEEKSANITAMMCTANKLKGNMQVKGWSAYTGQGVSIPC